MSLFLFPKMHELETPEATQKPLPPTRILLAFVEEYAPWREVSKSSAIVNGNLSVTSVAYSDAARKWNLTFDFQSTAVTVRALCLTKKDFDKIGTTKLTITSFGALMGFVKGQHSDFHARSVESLASYCEATGGNGAITPDAADRLFHTPQLTTITDASQVECDEHFDIRHAKRYEKVYLGLPTVMSESNPNLQQKKKGSKKNRRIPVTLLTRTIWTK